MIIATKHFTDFSACDRSHILELLDRAEALKREEGDYKKEEFLEGRTIALLLELPTTRTRVHFETVIARLGGRVLTFRPEELQLGRGESVADTARFLSSTIRDTIAPVSTVRLGRAKAGLR